MQINLKLAVPPVDKGIVDAMERVPGVRKVTQTFPSRTNASLATLFVLEVEPDQLTQTLKVLRGLPGVERVEGPAPRKLIRGMG